MYPLVDQPHQPKLTICFQGLIVPSLLVDFTKEEQGSVQFIGSPSQVLHKIASGHTIPSLEPGQVDLERPIVEEVFRSFV